MTLSFPLPCDCCNRSCSKERCADELIRVRGWIVQKEGANRHSSPGLQQHQRKQALPQQQSCQWTDSSIRRRAACSLPLHEHASWTVATVVKHFNLVRMDNSIILLLWNWTYKLWIIASVERLEYYYRKLCSKSHYYLVHKIPAVHVDAAARFTYATAYVVVWDYCNIIPIVIRDWELH